MKPNELARGRVLIWAGALLVVFTIACLVWEHGSGSGTETETLARTNSHAELVKLLTDLQPVIVGATNGPGMLRFANDIESELKRNPLPAGDEFQFSGELVVRYLKTLGNLEVYRERKLAKGEADPLSAQSSNANREAIATRNKYLPWLRERSRELREMLTNSVPAQRLN